MVSDMVFFLDVGVRYPHRWRATLFSRCVAASCRDCAEQFFGLMGFMSVKFSNIFLGAKIAGQRVQSAHARISMPHKCLAIRASGSLGIVIAKHGEAVDCSGPATYFAHPD
jgi:hypothetical protein